MKEKEPFTKKKYFLYPKRRKKLKFFNGTRSYTVQQVIGVSISNLQFYPTKSDSIKGSLSLP